MSDPIQVKAKQSVEMVDPSKPIPLLKEKGNYLHHEPSLNELIKISAKIGNPFAGKSVEEIESDAERFCQLHNLNEHVGAFRHGAVLAADPANVNRLSGLTSEERRWIEHEKSHKWKQPFMMYYVAAVSSIAAIARGMDAAVVNGAQDLYFDRFGIPTDGTNKTASIQGLVNGAPYLCCAVLSCWLTDPLNRLLGRRGVIFLSCAIAGIASIWEAFTYSWPQLFASRLLLGLAIGPKSATAPVYTAECSPAPIRGALVMQWEVWNAFGIALGYIVSVIFFDRDPDLAWRLMLGSTFFAPIMVCAMAYYAPESPRWYISKGRVGDAFQSIRRLRFCDLQAARDLYYMAELLKIEKTQSEGRNLLRDLFMVPRVRRAAQASGIVMFVQQFCGINAITYYISELFYQAGFNEKQTLLASLGTGLVDWVFALLALCTIDAFGRRNLLLVTFPAMAICLLATGMSFFIPRDDLGDLRRVGVTAASTYLYMAFYGLGGGPVPFTYSAEAFPLYIRDLGMGYATAVCWFFKFVLDTTFPLLLSAFKPQGVFGWYAGWCCIGWVLVLFFLPETKALTLEEMDLVFSVPMGKHAAYQFHNAIFCMRRYVLRQRVQPLPPLHHMDKIELGATY